MKTFRGDAILVLMTLFLISLNHAYSYSPLQFNSRILPPAQQIPEEYLLFIPDTSSQILFNPARAVKTRSRFIHGTYNSVYRRKSPMEPNIIITTLFGKENSKWLLVLGNGINNTENTINRSHHKNSYSLYGNSQMENSHNREDVENHSITLVRCAHIWNSDHLGFSLGLTGILNHNQSILSSSSLASSTQFDERSSSNGQDILYQKHLRFQDGSHNFNTRFNNTDYALGLEFSLSASTWDWINRVGIQKSDYDAYNRSNLYQIHFDSAYSTMLQPDTILNISTRQTARTSQTDCGLDSKPQILSFKSIWQHQTGLITPEDHLFISIYGAYGSGEEQYHYDEKTDILREYNGTSEPNDTLVVTQKGDDESAFRQTTLSIGYLINKQTDNLTLITGLHPNVSYIHEKGFSVLTTSDQRKVVPGNQLVFNTSETIKTSLTFPVIFYYSPLPWFRLFGGFQYDYGYRKQNLDSETPAVTQYIADSDEIQPNSLKEHQQETTRSSLNGSRMFHMGCTLKYKNKGVAHILFNDDMASTRMWNVSLGYYF